MITRLPVWCAIGGIILGLSLSALGASGEKHNTPLLLVGGFIATGGPILALVLGMYRRLDLRTLRTRPATLLGLVSGVVAVGVALGLERALGLVVDHGSRAPDESLLVLAGPIEEGAKLLVPVVLLAAGVTFLRDPRLGVWTVLLSSGLFGATEGAVYAAGLGGADTGSHPGDIILKEFPHLDASLAGVLAELVNVTGRTWVELGHPIWTTGAAAIIWLAVHRRAKAVVWIAVGAYLIAAAIHSFNDGVLPRLPGALPVLASIVWIYLGYVLWFRPRTRCLVPPNVLAEVPRRWVPPVPPATTRHRH